MRSPRRWRRRRWRRRPSSSSVPSCTARSGCHGRSRRTLRRAASIGARRGRGAARPVRFPFHDRRLAHLRSELRRAWRPQRGVGLSAARRRRTMHGRRRSAIRRRVREGARGATSLGAATVALVHATAYSDDQQMMLFVARQLRGGRPDGASGEPAPICAGTAAAHALRPNGGRVRSISSSASSRPTGSAVSAVNRLAAFFRRRPDATQQSRRRRC